MHGAVLAITAQHVGIGSYCVIGQAVGIKGTIGHFCHRGWIGILAIVKNTVSVKISRAEYVGKIIRISAGTDQIRYRRYLHHHPPQHQQAGRCAHESDCPDHPVDCSEQ